MAEDEKDRTAELAAKVEQLAAERDTLRQNFETSEAKRKSLNKALDDAKSQWGGISPDEAKAAVEFQRSYQDGGGDADARFADFQKVTEQKYRAQADRDKGQIVSAHKEAEAGWNEERTQMLAQLNKWGRDSKVRQFMGDQGNADLAVRLAAAETKLMPVPGGTFDFVVLNSDGNPRLDANGQPLLLDAHMATWRDDPVYKSLFTGHGVQGGSTPAGGRVAGGANGNEDVGKAFDPETLNLTQISELARSDPARARELAAKHGVQIPQGATRSG